METKRRRPMGKDITEQKLAELEAKLDYLTYHDVLTGLANSTLFHERVEQAMAQAGRNGRPAAILFVDLDRFKRVNDTLGRAIGDELLKQAGTRLSECVGSSDTVGRFGGDDFGVILSDLAKTGDASLVAKKIIDTLARPFDLNAHRILVTGSVGITLYPDDATSPEALIANADAAMYRAKEQGRNNYQYFTREMNQHAKERMQLEALMRRAIERQEFVLHYQPKIDAQTRRIEGVEALIRWQSPQLGLVPPMQFIPLLEETGLIFEVGAWALRQAAFDHRRWRKLGLAAPRVAVNVSPVQLRRRD